MASSFIRDTSSGELRIPGGGAANDRATETPLIAQIIAVLIRQKWVIIGMIASALVLGVIVTLLITPKYTASTTIEIQRETGNFADLQGSEQKQGLFDQEFYQTQYGLLQSQALAEHVATSLRLYDNADFFSTMKSSRKKWFADGRVVTGSSTRAERTRAAADLLLAHLSVDPQRLSRLVELHFTSPSPALSQRVVNQWATDFIQVTLDRRYDATAYSRRFLEQRLVQLRTRMDEAERNLVRYARQEGIVNLPGIGGGAGGASQGPEGGERSLAAIDLSTLNTELASAIGDRLRAQSRLREAGASAESLTNPTISSLRQRRAELAADYAKLMAQFEPGYPPAKALQSQIAILDQSIMREENRVGSSMQQAYAASLAREQALRQKVNELKANVLDYRQRSIQYNILQRDIDTTRQLYDGLLQRYKAIGAAGGVGVTNISIVDRAELPQIPSSPNLLLNIVLSLLIGGVMGIGVAMLLEQMDQGFSNPQDIQRLLGYSLIGTIPQVANDTTDSQLQDRKSVLSEAYSSLQTNLSFATPHGMPRTITVTSTKPAEGKSTTSYALARLSARTRHRTILIDGDLRSPSVHRLMGLANTAGVSNFLAGHDDLDTLIQASEVDGLAIITSGPIPPSAPELLSSDRFATLLNRLRERFDYVIVDAPPVMGLADAPLIASRTESTVFVVEFGQTHRAMVKVAIERLAAAHVKPVGIVLTKFASKNATFGYGYSYSYGEGATVENA